MPAAGTSCGRHCRPNKDLVRDIVRVDDGAAAIDAIAFSQPVLLSVPYEDAEHSILAALQEGRLTAWGLMSGIGDLVEIPAVQ